MKKSAQKIKGNTLTEIIIVIIIIGVLASLALPKYQWVVYKSEAAEAKTILPVIFSAQKSYYFENGVYPTTTAEVNEINLSTLTFKYLSNVPVIGTGPIALNNQDDSLNPTWRAYVWYTRISGKNVQLIVNPDGSLRCQVGGEAPPTTCKRLGW